MEKELPILFNTLMAKAVLSNVKTQTRRPIKLDGKPLPTEWLSLQERSSHTRAVFADRQGREYFVKIPFTQMLENQPATVVLWVRETFQISDPYGDHARGDRTAKIIYKAGGEITIPLTDDSLLTHQWRPGIFMPREYARLFRQVLTVRPERLQDISLDDIYAEGILMKPPRLAAVELAGQSALYSPETVDRWNSLAWSAYTQSARKAFADVWNSTKPAPGFAWRDNPWVWRVEFAQLSDSVGRGDDIQFNNS